MPLDYTKLKEFCHVRVNHGQVRLKGVTQGIVNTDLIATSNYFDRDRFSSQYQFSGQSFKFGYEYDATAPDKVLFNREIPEKNVWPTAFTIWTVRINEDIDLSELTAIEIILKGKAIKD